MSWCNEIRWQTNAGEVLLALIQALPKDREFRLTLSGSAPLQLSIDPQFLSADVNLFADDARDIRRGHH